MFDYISAGGVIPLLARLLKDFFSVDLVHMRAESSRKVALFGSCWTPHHVDSFVLITCFFFFCHYLANRTNYIQGTTWHRNCGACASLGTVKVRLMCMYVWEYLDGQLHNLGVHYICMYWQISVSALNDSF